LYWQTLSFVTPFDEHGRVVDGTHRGLFFLFFGLRIFFIFYFFYFLFEYMVRWKEANCLNEIKGTTPAISTLYWANSPGLRTRGPTSTQLSINTSILFKCYIFVWLYLL
jgi:hypothetical protein